MINKLATYSQNAVNVLQEVKVLMDSSTKARLELKAVC